MEKKKSLKKNRIMLTKEGFVALEAEYKDLIDCKRPEVLKEIQNARSMGDLSENGMYHAARQKLSFMQGRIIEVEEILKKAEIIDSRVKSGVKKADLGSIVVVADQEKMINYSLVSPHEVNIAVNKISLESPIGKSLYGRRIGDTVEFEAPAGKKKLKVIEIR
ncbi:hypothetical protein A2982_04000 [candidate division WWE3 bacterium RIFCSPLOWO2_01_FULL_39_13]|uniref:Transcription elongation factor GreA n=1 Tax=candidate division WWE3 bacterium RIFCSPLOWO2_01_FULL_39_13 TaxID=1802624 RepID=A0A1F4V3V7_UNCKA|nr:MAG: hypothetical protein A2982_04000 [candidate division WWE3 bacterium RIFCSPLOWO2_01_FULL_39_13]